MPNYEPKTLYNRLSEHLTFALTSHGTTRRTLHLVELDAFQTVDHDRSNVVTLTLTGKRTQRVLRLTMRDASDADVFNLFAERIRLALEDDLPDSETALIDALADYFEEEDPSETDAPDDALIVVLDDEERIIDLVGLPEEEERRFVLIRTMNDGSVGVIPVTSPMNYNIENRDDLLRMFNTMAKENAQRLQETDDETTPE